MKVQRYFMGFLSLYAKYLDLSFVVCFAFLQTIATTAVVGQSEAYDPNITFIDEYTSESSFRILADASTLVGENTYGESFMLAKHPDGYFTGDHLPIFPIPSGFLVRLTATSETGLVRRTEFFRYLEENPTLEPVTESEMLSCSDDLNHGESTSRERFSSPLVSQGDICERIVQNGVCENGAIEWNQGSYFEECRVYNPQISFVVSTETEFQISADAEILTGENQLGESFRLSKNEDGYFEGEPYMFPIPEGFMVRLTAQNSTGQVASTDFFPYLVGNPTLEIACNGGDLSHNSTTSRTIYDHPIVYFSSQCNASSEEGLCENGSIVWESESPTSCEVIDLAEECNRLDGVSENYTIDLDGDSVDDEVMVCKTSERLDIYTSLTTQKWSHTDFNWKDFALSFEDLDKDGDKDIVLKKDVKEFAIKLLDNHHFSFTYPSKNLVIFEALGKKHVRSHDRFESAILILTELLQRSEENENISRYGLNYLILQELPSWEEISADFQTKRTMIKSATLFAPENLASKYLYLMDIARYRKDQDLQAVIVGLALLTHPELADKLATTFDIDRNREVDWKALMDRIQINDWGRDFISDIDSSLDFITTDQSLLTLKQFDDFANRFSIDHLVDSYSFSSLSTMAALKRRKDLSSNIGVDRHSEVMSGGRALVFTSFIIGVGVKTYQGAVKTTNQVEYIKHYEWALSSMETCNHLGRACDVFAQNRQFLIDNKETGESLGVDYGKWDSPEINIETRDGFGEIMAVDYAKDQLTKAVDKKGFFGLLLDGLIDIFTSGDEEDSLEPTDFGSHEPPPSDDKKEQPPSNNEDEGNSDDADGSVDCTLEPENALCAPDSTEPENEDSNDNDNSEGESAWCGPLDDKCETEYDIAMHELMIEEQKAICREFGLECRWLYPPVEHFDPCDYGPYARPPEDCNLSGQPEAVEEEYSNTGGGVIDCSPFALGCGEDPAPVVPLDPCVIAICDPDGDDGNEPLPGPTPWPSPSPTPSPTWPSPSPTPSPTWPSPSPTPPY